MLTTEEEKFVNYWSEQRLKKKRSIRQFTFGLPLAVGIVLAVFANLISGWHKKASMVIQSNSSIILVIVIAAVGIVVFMTAFSRNYEWEQNEQRYKELLLKKEQPGDAAN